MKNPLHLKDEARDEAYDYFDKNIRKLIRAKDGKIDPTALGLEGNDVDAFRHAYVSGVFTQEYNEEAADIFGQLNEFFNFSLSSVNSGAENMDLWNNSVGRKCGKETKNRQDLLKMIHRTLKNGDLITNPKDSRKHTPTTDSSGNRAKTIVVLKEESGRNEIFYDAAKDAVLSREQFIALIENGNYPGYAVKKINGIFTPVSKPDESGSNNLG